MSFSDRIPWRGSPARSALRIALGVTEGQVMCTVPRSAAALVATGILIGLPVAIWSLRVATAVLETQARDDRANRVRTAWR
jgi:ABC-type antimicrobial peptide transport system permease subunit